ncbi:hypothetical protein [Niastella sp. OAS944]|uniref:hypothetical protein n=1 Tax=Niastella sp. OAS944 TaxID=2664089 RepID=UPI0034979BC6|nr:hypothetical protein [Chitinophagaceae bacterium OAS944]
MSQYGTYLKFYSPDDAQFLIEILQPRNIPYKLEHEVNQLDKVYIGESIDPMFALQIPTAHFTEVNNLLAEQAKADMQKPGFEHLMQSYTTEDLQEIINEPAGYNAYDLQVAMSLLAQITPDKVLTPVTNTDTFVPYKLETIWIALGYIVSILGAAFFYLGIAGFFAGLVVHQSQKTLKNGTIVKMYSPNSRKHARNMMLLSVLATCISLLLLFGYIKTDY